MSADLRKERGRPTVADLMREWRAVAGMSRESAGARLGLSANAVRDIEQGLRRADDELSRIGLEKLLVEARNTR